MLELLEAIASSRQVALVRAVSVLLAPMRPALFCECVRCCQLASVDETLSLPRFQNTLTQKTLVFGCFVACGRLLATMVGCNST